MAGKDLYVVLEFALSSLTVILKPVLFNIPVLTKLYSFRTTANFLLLRMPISTVRSIVLNPFVLRVTGLIIYHVIVKSSSSEWVIHLGLHLLRPEVSNFGYGEWQLDYLVYPNHGLYELRV